jgi:hypothetical protein
LLRARGRGKWGNLMVIGFDFAIWKTSEYCLYNSVNMLNSTELHS